jgi:two-component sensor histidine kinase
MNKNRLIEYITHPVSISLVIWAILVLLIPPLFSKYKIKHIHDEYTTPNVWNFFLDYDNDKLSEKISFDLNDPEQTKIIVSKNGKILNQYDLKYQPADINSVYSGDYNKDGYLELYVYTMNQDSIFLNVIDPYLLRKTIISNRFIDFRKKAPQSVDTPRIETAGMIGDRNKIFKDLIFFINTGYSKQPRKLYRYSIAEDSLLKSPESAADPTKCTIVDLNNDYLPDFILNVLATGNYDEEFPYTDNYSWLMVLDNRLKFLFPPVKFSEHPSSLMVIPIKLKEHTRLIVFNDYFGAERIASTFDLMDIKGNKINEKPLKDFESIYSYIFNNSHTDKSTFYFLKNRNATIDEIDSSFRVINTIRIPQVERGQPLAYLDANFDGEKEYLFQGSGNRSLIITQNDFKNPVSYDYKEAQGNPFISQVLTPGSKPMLYLQFRDYGSLIKYDRNPFFYFKYPFYIVLYLCVYLFITMIARIQQYRLNLKLQTERKIASLQFKAVKNQVDPHFTLNILNAIGSLYATEENRDKADYIFSKYARLIRQTVVSSDQIIITLAEELEFVRNYVDLERFRCDNSFDYAINTETGIDLQSRIPRMLIHTFVENAIKYAIRRRSEGGLLKISLIAKDYFYQILVEDNGPGLVESSEATDKSTGKGLLILNELIELYYKLEKVKINYTLQNITGEDNKVSGTIATIEIPQKIPKS